jgi:glycosyltransferase involved in cell wall biosynthesis
MRKHVYIANQSKQTLGGGFIFLDNLKKGVAGKCTFVDSWKDAHIIFIGSVTMTTREEIINAKNAKRRIVLRIDNMPKDSRNRGTAFSRMKDFANLADVIIFQSEWAKDYVGSWLKNTCGVDTNKGHVIYNGVDTDYFYHKDHPAIRGDTYLFCTFNTDENKRFPEAAYDFHLKHRKAKQEKKPLPKLKLVGNFGKDLPSYKFDFFDGENISYSPPIADRNQLGNIYRSCQYLYFPAFADAAPNTVSEAIACGCEVLLANPIGGTVEVIRQFKSKVITIQEMANKYLEIM